jgi:DNA invertase Pin-like site-specific DNA recombinase
MLIMSEESRLGREQIETAYALKQIVDAGVRLFFYQEDRERTLETPMDKAMLSLAAFAAETERDKARQRTYDAMARKAQARHVTGGKVYGYDNPEVLSPEAAADDDESVSTSCGGSTKPRRRGFGGSSSCIPRALG